MVKLTIIMPCKYLWPVKSLCKQANGVFNEVSYIDETRVMLQSHLPLAKVIVGFFEDLKRITRLVFLFLYEVCQFFLFLILSSMFFFYHCSEKHFFKINFFQLFWSFLNNKINVLLIRYLVVLLLSITSMMDTRK